MPCYKCWSMLKPKFRKLVSQLERFGNHQKLPLCRKSCLNMYLEGTQGRRLQSSPYSQCGNLSRHRSGHYLHSAHSYYDSRSWCTRPLWLRRGEKCSLSAESIRPRNETLEAGTLHLTICGARSPAIYDNHLHSLSHPGENKKGQLIIAKSTSTEQL